MLSLWYIHFQLLCFGSDKWRVPLNGYIISYLSTQTPPSPDIRLKLISTDLPLCPLQRSCLEHCKMNKMGEGYFLFFVYTVSTYTRLDRSPTYQRTRHSETRKDDPTPVVSELSVCPNPFVSGQGPLATRGRSRPCAPEGTDGPGTRPRATWVSRAVRRDGGPCVRAFPLRISVCKGSLVRAEETWEEGLWTVVL